ncbi:ABC transporter substrate-binding protein [uncultured Treponema sp.]|uniref:ABC transporter substrate-binding protein n=1 Tax=uncultured Treponema sp. TaxID=162155 RepID=UPI0025EB53D4|nr:ABC transporter substrate-binding protein [uncultured Treponema sp.]
MKINRIALKIIFFFATGLFSFGGNGFASGKSDKTVSASLSEPKNVVALSKSIAEMWLLSGGKVRGTTSDALELSGIGDAVSVGSLTTSSLEAILSLEPELVLLTQDIPLHKKMKENLSSLGIKTYVADVKFFADYEKTMADFTSLTGRKDLFEKNVLSVKKEIEKIIQAQKKKTESAEKAATFLFLRASPTKNKALKEHFGNEIFENLGLKSIISDKNPLDDLSVEAIIASDPDYIFVVAQGSEKRAEEAFYRSFESNPAWSSLSAVKNGRVKMIPRELFNYKPNERWAEAYSYIADYLNK